MRQVAMLVEGPTEEAIVRDVLVPAALRRAICLVPVIVITSATPAGARRGGGHWRHYNKQLRALLRGSHWHRVGLLIDYYQYPPGRTRPGCRVPEPRGASARHHPGGRPREGQQRAEHQPVQTPRTGKSSLRQGDDGARPHRRRRSLRDPRALSRLRGLVGGPPGLTEPIGVNRLLLAAPSAGPPRISRRVRRQWCRGRGRAPHGHPTP